METFSALDLLRTAPSNYISNEEIERYRPKGGFNLDKWKSAFNYGKAQKNEKKGGLESVGGGLAKQFLENSEKRRDRDDLLRALQRPAQPFGGAGLAGRSFSLGDGSLTQINPDTFEPIVIPGGGAGVAGRSTGQRIAGAAGGAFQGFRAGAETGLPHMAGIGAIVGGLGGFFG